MALTEQCAFLNWRMDKLDRSQNYAMMAEGYWKAAVRLLDSLLGDNAGHDADPIVFPILFDAHQSLELYLKATRIAVCEAKGANPWSVNIKSIHDLDKLTSSLNSALDAGDERLTRTKETTTYFELVDLLKSVGDDSGGGYYVDFARYPEKESGKSYVFVRSDRFVLKLEELKGAINDGCQFMDGFYWLWQGRVDAVRCMKADLEQGLYS